MNYRGPSPGSLLSFAINDGYPEGILRGYKLGLLGQADYANLSQCDVIDVRMANTRLNRSCNGEHEFCDKHTASEDFSSYFSQPFSGLGGDLKIHLQTTAYGDFLDNEPSPLAATTIGERCTGKMVEEFEYLRSCAVAPLSSFLDYIRYGYMIDNVVLLISGTIHEREPEALKAKLHPLGIFEGINSIQSSGSLADLYDDILVDTPLAPYIQGCLSVEDLNEMNIEIIRNTLFKAYLEDFAAFCEKLGGVTAESMLEILTFEADRRSINITLNSFGTEIQRDERFKLYPSLGLLYPEGLERFKRADDAEQVRTVIESYPAYRELFSDASISGGDDEKTLEDAFVDYEVKLNRLAFTRQGAYSAFYSYFKLKEQEIRYIVWIAECILQGRKDKISQFSHVV